MRHRRWGDIKGKKLGVVGLGGLGHMGVKFARAFGAHVVVFTTSPNKKEDALRLGADEVIISSNAEEMQKHAGTFDFILDTIAETQEMLYFCAEHGITSDIEVIKIQDINEAYERLLKSDVKYRFVIDMAALKA